MLNKIVATVEEAVADVHDGASIMIGGFGGAGVADGLLQALIRQGAKSLTLIANHAGRGETGMAVLVKQDRVAKVICTFPEAKDAQIFREKYLAGKVELELVPQGTLSERMRAGGSGIEGFYNHLPQRERRARHRAGAGKGEGRYEPRERRQGLHHHAARRQLQPSGRFVYRHRGHRRDAGRAGAARGRAGL